MKFFNGDNRPSLWRIINIVILIGTLVYVIGVRDAAIDNNSERIERVNQEMMRKLDYIQGRVDFLIERELNRK